MTHALALPIPSSLGNIDAYITAANRYPMLSEAEETRLAERFHNEGDVEAARQLVLSHLRLERLRAHYRHQKENRSEKPLLPGVSLGRPRLRVPKD